MSEIISLLSDSEEEFQTSETPTNFRNVKKEPEEEEPLECPRGLQATDPPKNLQDVKKEPKEEEEPEEVKDDEPSASLQLQNTRQERQELQKKLQELARRESLLEMQVEVENLERAREKRAAKPNARRKNQPVNATLRQLIYERMEDGFAAKDVAELYNVSQGTVYNIHKQGAEPPHKKRRRSGPKSIYDNYEVIVFLLDLIEKEPELTLEQTVERLDNKGYQTSETALCRFYKGAKLTWKKIYPITHTMA